MDITFGICLGPDWDERYVRRLLDSIDDAYIAIDPRTNKHEILMIGPQESVNDAAACKRLLGESVRTIPFDESQKRGWITRKKNILAREARYENLCIMHDYYTLDRTWVYGSLQHAIENPNWDVMCNAIYRKEGDRHSDWLVDQKYTQEMIDAYPEIGEAMMKAGPTEQNGPKWVCGLPYSENQLTHIQYVSGGLIFARTALFEAFPFDERYGWGEAPEDILWSRDIIRGKANIQFNRYSSARIQKPNKWLVHEMPDVAVRKLKEMFGTSDNKVWKPRIQNIQI